MNHPAFNRSTDYSKAEVAKVYPPGHPEHRASENMTVQQRARKMTFYAAPGDFLKKKVLDKQREEEKGDPSNPNPGGLGVPKPSAMKRPSIMRGSGKVAFADQ